MFGQEIIPGAQLTWPDRRQLATWRKAEDLAEQCSDLALACRLASVNAAVSYQFGQRHGFDVPPPKDLEADFLDTEAKFKKLFELFQRVQAHQLAVQFNEDGSDFAIVDPRQQQQASELGIWPYIAIGGLVILAGAAVVGLVHYRDKFKAILPKYNALNMATDQIFCKEGSPDTCAEWQKFKKEAGYQMRADAIDDITDQLGRAAVSGAKWGLTIGIPILALWLIWQFKKSR